MEIIQREASRQATFKIFARFAGSTESQFSSEVDGGIEVSAIAGDSLRKSAEAV